MHGTHNGDDVWRPPLPRGWLLWAAAVLVLLLPCLGLGGSALYLNARPEGAGARGSLGVLFVGPAAGAALAVGTVALLWADARRKNAQVLAEWTHRTRIAPLPALLRRLDDLDARQRRGTPPSDPDPALVDLLDELCPAYLDAPAPERAGVRDAVQDKVWVLNALLAYVYRAAERIHSPKDRGWLWRGLAAVSMENCSQDYRDVLVALSKLYAAAQKAGIPPRPDFKAVARISSDEIPRGGSQSVQALLGDYRR